MSAETFSYKGISAGKYIEGEIEAINQEEASFKLKEQKVIITNLIKTKKKKGETKEKAKGKGLSLFGKKKIKVEDILIFFLTFSLFSNESTNFKSKSSSLPLASPALIKFI